MTDDLLRYTPLDFSQENLRIKSDLVALFPIFQSLRLIDWGPITQLVANHGKIDFEFAKAVLSSQMIRSDKDQVIKLIFDSINPKDLLTLQDQLSPITLEKLIEKLMMDQTAIDDEKTFYLLAKATIQLDDIDNMNALIMTHPERKVGQYISLVRSVDALELIESQKDPNTFKSLLFKAAEIAPLDYLKKILSDSQLEIEPLKNDLLLRAIRGNSLPTVKYLVEVHNVAVTPGTVTSIAHYASAQVLDYIMSIQPDIITNDTLTTLVDNRKYQLNVGTIKESIDLFQRRLASLRILLKSPNVDPSANDSQILMFVYPTINRYQRGMSKEIIEEVDHLIAEYSTVIISDPRVNPAAGIREASRNENEHALRVLLSDYRVNINNSLPQLGGVNVHVQRTIAFKLEKEKKKRLRALREIASLKGLNFYQQYQLLETLSSQNQLDSESEKLLENPDFQVAYLSTNEDLAELLNARSVPVLKDINHAAASALYAKEINVFREMVPISTYEEYLQLT
ncbi:Hypothetical protein POVR1_LOCUS519 [uncultured virus]|nr:Hypothetical protein POVR1_LOCUS519 [uncultured virus]